MCLQRNKEGKCRVLSRRFCLFNSAGARPLFHLSPRYPRIIIPSDWLLNHIDKILETEPQDLLSASIIST